MGSNNFVLLLLWLFIFNGRFASGQQKMLYDRKSPEVSALQYQPIDIIFKVSSLPPDNPFDLTFGGTFTDRNNKSQTIYGFYNGKNEYVLRYCAESPGVVSYQTFSNLNVLAGLDGTISVLKNDDPSVHGAVKIASEAPQKFIYQDGTPYFALAFELDWLFALDANDKHGLPKTTEIIRAVKANGFNQIIMNLYAYDVSWNTAGHVPAQYSFKKPTYSVFKGTNAQPDFKHLNIEFFQHFDRVIQHLHESGIVAHVMIYVWNKKVNWPQMYSAEDNLYFDYVIKRYQAYPNVIWDVSKEALDYGRCDIPYINERIERIRSLDTYKRLVTVHDYEYCSREPDKVDFISIQNWRSDLYSLSFEAYQKHPNKPIMNIEHGGYEEGPYSTFTGNYTNAEVCLERNYACVFAGVYSSYYWQNTSWDIVIYDIMGNNQILPKPRFDFYYHLQTLFTKYNYNQLAPYKPKLTTNSRLGLDNLATSGYPLTDNQGLYLYFVPSNNYMINVVIPKPASGKMEAKWLNIFTGETLEHGSKDWQLFRGYQSPWAGQSAVLIIDTK